MKCCIRLVFSLTAVALLAGSRFASASLVNGDFETGDFSGWTVTDQTGGNGTWFISSPGAVTPLSGFNTAPNASGGNFYAVTDQGGPGAHALTQSFVADSSSITVSFDMFVNDQSGSGGIVDPAGLDFGAVPNQHARVDILVAGATAFSTAAADIVSNLYLGVDPGPTPNPFTHYSIVVSGLSVGSTYQIRFAEVDNQFFFHQGIDNVSITSASVVPEPASIVLLGVGMAVAAYRRLRATQSRD